MALTPLLTALVGQAARAARLPANLLAAQVLHESDGDPWAFRYELVYFRRMLLGKTTKGTPYGPLAACSYGLLQILYETALEVGFSGEPHQLFDPQTNLTLGATIMRNLWDWAGGLDEDYARALSAYNGGKGTAQHGPPYPNQAYVDAVYQIAHGDPRAA